MTKVRGLSREGQGQLVDQEAVMQKLSAGLKNTPGGASPAPCSVSGGLNREETLSDAREKTCLTSRREVGFSV